VYRISDKKAETYADRVVAMVTDYNRINGRKYGSVAEWLACRTEAQKDLGSNRSRDAVGQRSEENCSHQSCLCSPSSETGSSLLKGCEGNCGLGGK